MIIGSNPRKEAPVLNARIRKRWRTGGLKIGVIGEHADLTYDYDYLGAGTDTLASFAEQQAGRSQAADAGSSGRARWRGRTARRCSRRSPRRRFRSARSPTAGTAFRCCTRRRPGWAASTSASCRATDGLDAAAMAQGGVDLLFLLGADEIEVEPGPFVVYIGTHGDRGAHRADVILPGAAYTEKSGIYVNTEGRVQRAGRAAFPPGDAREDWAILRALSDVLGVRLPYNSLAQLRADAVQGVSPPRRGRRRSRRRAPTT